MSKKILSVTLAVLLAFGSFAGVATVAGVLSFVEASAATALTAESTGYFFSEKKEWPSEWTAKGITPGMVADTSCIEYEYKAGTITLKLAKAKIPDTNNYFQYVAMKDFASYDETPWGADSIAASDITKVIIEKGILNVGAYAFNGTNISTQDGSQSNLVFGEDVLRIGEYSFADCSMLETINIPEGIAYIDEGAFKASALTKELVIPSTVIEIGDSAFEDCEEIKKLTVAAGSKLVSIGESAFAGCDSLEAITLREGLKSIGAGAFYADDKLYGVITIPTTVTEIGEAAFLGCSSITSINVPQKTKVVKANTFTGCSSLQNVTIYEGVTAIEDGAFAACGFETIKLPTTLESIGKNSFTACEKLTAIIIPEKVQVIPEGAFSDCISLHHVTISEKLSNYATNEGRKAILEDAFAGDDIKYIYYTGNEESWLMFHDHMIESGNDSLLNAKKPTDEGLEKEDPVIVWNANYDTPLTALTLTGISNIIVARDGVTAEYTLTPVFTPAGVSEDKKFVYWECEGATGIDVDNGVVKAENDGTVTVTAIGHNGVKAIQVLTFISLDINPKTAIIERGVKLQIIPTITPAGTTTTCTFKTSNDAVASVDENGLVTGNSQGRAEITVQTTPDTNGEVMTKICSVEVTDLTLTPDKTIIKTGESNYALITARGTDRNLTYTSSDDTIAGVSVEANKKDAKVIGKKGGKVTITAIAEGTDEEIKAEVEINVVSIDKITYSDKIKNREVDKNTYDNDTEKSKYKAFCVINDGKEVDPVWTSSNEDVAEVSADGTLKIKANGTTTIRAAYPGDASIYEEATLNVGGLYIPSTVMADDGKIYMKPESQSEFTPTYSKGKAGEVFTYKVEPVGTIDKDKMTYSGGNGVGFKSGKDSEGKYNFTISVMQNDKVVAHAALTVVVLNVTVPSGTVYQAKGKTIAPSAIDIVINPANDTGKWSSSDEKIATVDEQSGLVTTVEAGTTNITYTCGGVSASYKVVVVEGAFAQKEVALAIGDTANVKLNVTSNPAGIEYTSSDESIATVDESGKVTGIKAGKVTITGEFKGLVKDTCEVTVYDIKFPASDAPVYIPSGDSKSASELGINTPAGEGTWTSSNPSVATVDSFGKITTVGPGKTTITYELNGFKKTIEVVVFTVEMAESTYYTAVGDSVTLTFKLNDGSAGQTNPAGTVWTSSDNSTISVAGGKATALKAGKATITATYQGKSATATVYGIAAGQIVLTDSEKKVVTDELLIGNTYTATIKVSAPEGFESSKLAVTGFTAAGGNEYVKTISPSKVEKITVSADIQYNGNTMFTRTAAFDVADLVVKEGENSITSKTVTAGTSFTVNATYSSSSGTSKPVSAKSSNIETATVSANGSNYTISTKRAGSTVITFTANNLEKKVNVTVAGVPIQTLTIDNHGVSKVKRAGRNQNYQFGYTISPANAEAVNVIWTSSNKDIAEVNNNGLVSVKNKPGKTVITVTVTDSTGATRSAATTLEVEMTLLERIVAFFRNIIETVVKLFTSAG